jgi:hypothetical protein
MSELSLALFDEVVIALGDELESLVKGLIHSESFEIYKLFIIAKCNYWLKHNGCCI